MSLHARVFAQVRVAVLGALVALVTAAPAFAQGSFAAVQDPPAPSPAPAPPAYRISGLVFGDYYAFASDHLPTFDSQHGLWIRRAYFTYDHTFSPTVTTRLRLEANGNGKLSGGAITPFIKDAYVRWTFHGRQQITVGIQPSLTFDFLDAVWGLRHIEKTPLDLYKWDSSRDTGFTLAGPLNAARTLKYQLQFGNESGSNGETDHFKGYRVAARYETNPGVTVEGMFAFFNRADNADRTTAQMVVAYRAKRARAGFQYSFQKRRAADDSGLTDVTMSLVSGFGVFDVKPQKVSAFVRVDRYFDPCPDCSGIDYLPIDAKEAFTLTIAGIEYYIHPSVRFSPNVEWVTYGNPETGSTPKTDVAIRLTFYWVW